MIGVVIVSHSPRLAEAAVELGMQMVHGDPPPIRIAAGVAGGYGTDAAAVAAAIDEVGAATDVTGVLVIPDLGSAVLSAGLALEFRESTTEVVVSSGPFAEGITAGLVLAAAGAPLEEVAREVAAALDAKREQAEPSPDPSPVPSPGSPPASSGPLSADEVLVNPEGLHARPAAMLVQAVGGYDALIDVTNLTTGTGPVAARSLIGLLSLGAKQGHRIRLDGRGPDAATAVAALRGLLVDGFGEVPASAAS
jgi:PTS hybrid protein